MSHILLADDSPHAQRMGEHILRGEGFNVTTVADGAAALASITQTNPDLIIADAFLPGSNGLELFRQIKKLRPYIRMILTAGSLEPVDKDAAKRAGCDAVLRKPFEASEVQAVVRPLLEHALNESARVQAAVEEALREALPALTRDIAEKVLIALENRHARQ
jgi:CheY-like chemotaxis protein